MEWDYVGYMIFIFESDSTGLIPSPGTATDIRHILVSQRHYWQGALPVF
jgi:hypothetical protein